MTPSNIKDLFAYRMNALASIYSKIAALDNKRKFGISMLDWRIIGLLAAFAPMSLSRLAQEANLDKGRASRAVATLIQDGFIDKALDENDGRGIALNLTRKGQALYKKLLPSAVRRNQTLLEILSKRDRKVVYEALTLLTQQAHDMLNKERSINRT